MGSCYQSYSNAITHVQIIGSLMVMTNVVSSNYQIAKLLQCNYNLCHLYSISAYPSKSVCYTRTNQFNISPSIGRMNKFGKLWMAQANQFNTLKLVKLIHRLPPNHVSKSELKLTFKSNNLYKNLTYQISSEGDYLLRKGPTKSCFKK